jgi:hypothetical protein
MCNKINKKILSILAAASVIISSLTIGLYFYFNNIPQYDKITLKGASNDEIIFLDLHNKHVSYDILNPLVNNSGYLLTRFFILDTDPFLIQTILNNNYIRATGWDNLNLIMDDNEQVEIDISINNLNIMIDNLILNIQFTNKIPTKIVAKGNYDVVDYSINNPFEDPIFRLLKKIESIFGYFHLFRNK